MYEKPQYFTKDGFRRLDRNPYSSPELEHQLALIRKKKAALKSAGTLQLKNKKPAISDEAATLIAGVLKGMLKNTGR
jgi:hypothetical protein